MTGGLVQMIQMIPSAELVGRLFKVYAPHMEIEKLKLPAGALKRANLLFKKMEDFVLKFPGEHSDMFKVLNTIALVNSDPSNKQLILDYLDDNAALRQVYQSLEYARMFGERHTIAAMAAFVAIECKSGNDSISSQAKYLWQTFLMNGSKIAQGNYIRVNITPPSKGEVERQIGIRNFQSELEKYIRKNNQQKDYIALVVPNQTSEGYVRYYVNTSPPERDVLQVYKGKAAFGPDVNMTGFEIRYYFITNRVWISETKAGDQRIILLMFLELVLGSAIDKRKPIHCEHRLAVLRNEERYLGEFQLPADLSGHGEKSYLSKLEIVVTERHAELVLRGDNEGVYLPATFTGTSALPIYNQISELLQDRFPSDLWNIKSAEITLELHPYVYERGVLLGPSTEITKVRLPIKPGGCTPVYDKKGRLDAMLHKDVDRIKAEWGLNGVDDATFNKMTDAQRNGGI